MGNIFIITELCNMHCSFCCFIRDHTNTKGKKRVYTPQELDSFIASIPDNIDNISLMGGEPLLFPHETEYAIKRIKEAYPSVEISLYTNASLLTPHLVDVINEYNVKMVFSINLYGEKGLSNLIKKARKNIDIIDLIMTVKNKSIRTIYPRKTDFAVDVFGLYKIFKCNIELSADSTKMRYWAEDDIVHLDKELNLLHKLSTNLGWFTFMPRGNSLCLCDNHYNIFLGYSSSRSTEFYSSRSIYGCCGLRDAMGDKLYNRYCVVLQNHFK